MTIPNAVDLFGGSESLKKEIARAVREARISKQFLAREIAHEAGIDLAILDALEEKEKMPDKHTLFSIICVLGLTLDRLMPLTLTMTKSQRSHWVERMRSRGSHALASADGCSTYEEETALRLFLRFEAVSEICAADALALPEGLKKLRERLASALALG